MGELPSTRYVMKYFPQSIWMPALKRLNILMHNIESGYILDAGCGSGWVSLYLCQCGYCVYSIDVSGEALEECSKIMSETGHSWKLKQASLVRLPFPDNLFQTVVCFDVLEHISSLDQALAELRRVLDRHGKVILTIPNKFGTYSLLKDLFIKPLILKLMVDPKQRIRYFHAHLHGFKWWARKFEQAKYHIVEVHNIEFLSPLLSFFGRRYTGKLTRLDIKLADRIPNIIASEWCFVLQKAEE